MHQDAAKVSSEQGQRIAVTVAKLDEVVKERNQQKEKTIALTAKFENTNQVQCTCSLLNCNWFTARFNQSECCILSLPWLFPNLQHFCLIESRTPRHYSESKKAAASSASMLAMSMCRYLAVGINNPPLPRCIHKQNLSVCTWKYQPANWRKKKLGYIE